MNKTPIDLYKNKVALVTGHTGFKGSWASLWLTELGTEVVGYSLEPPTKPNLFESINLEENITHIVGDVRDEAHLLKTVQKYQPDFVFHMAAQSIVRRSYENPRYTYETNVMGTVAVLEAMRQVENVRACIVVTSDKCYENKEWIYGYRETDPLGGYDPYSSSKGCAELVTAAYRKSFFNPETLGKVHNMALSSVRAGNVIGGGDWGEDRLLPDCIRALSHDEIILIRAPRSTRPWQYVLEPLGGYLLLGARMYADGSKYSDAWNFGPNDSNIVTVEELVNLIIKQWGSGTYATRSSDHLHEAALLKLDASKSRTLLGWKPTYSIDETVERTIDWYKNFYGGVKRDDLHELCVKEIRNFMSLL
ncbi:MAG TPA: CDP-glucose 4,6-dehydratase [Candidatus Acidoferrales bacterium]|nr:CDP-glucose 4,6-dehydratase [Candidatus Acidoferrales bacterium]